MNVKKTRLECLLAALILIISILSWSVVCTSAQEQTGSEMVLGKVAAGLEHSAFINYDGQAYLWGNNSYGQLGTDNLEYSDEPMRIFLPTITVDISLGSYHTLILLENGDVYACGRNSFGQLGNGTTEPSGRPIKIESLPKIQAISAGAFHSMALAEDGSVWAWGNNTQLQIGDVYAESILDEKGEVLGSRCTSPVRIIPSDAAAIAAGGQHSLYLDNKGLVYAWGDNSRGQLGNGSSQNSGRPAIVNGLEDVRLIAAGYLHNLVVSSSSGHDAIWAWGDDTHGQLGIGSDLQVSSFRSTPVRSEPAKDYTPLPLRIAMIAAGYTHSAAAGYRFHNDETDLNRQQFWFWGNNSHGQLGIGSSSKNLTRPVLLSGIYYEYHGDHFLPLDSMAAGGYHTLLLSSKGLMAAAGKGESGQLGNVSILNREQFTNIRIPDVIRPAFLPGSRLNPEPVNENEYLLRWPQARDNIAVSGYKVFIRTDHDDIRTLTVKNREYVHLPDIDPQVAYEIIAAPFDDASADAHWQDLSRLVAYILPENGSEIAAYFPDPAKQINQFRPYSHNWQPAIEGNVQALDVPWKTTMIYGPEAIPPPGSYLPVLITALISFLLVTIILVNARHKNKNIVRKPDIKLTVNSGGQKDTGR